MDGNRGDIWRPKRRAIRIRKFHIECQPVSRWIRQDVQSDRFGCDVTGGPTQSPARRRLVRARNGAAVAGVEVYGHTIICCCASAYYGQLIWTIELLGIESPAIKA